MDLSAHQSLHPRTLNIFWLTKENVKATTATVSKFHHLGPIQNENQFNSKLSHERVDMESKWIPHPPPPPFQHQWDCSLILSQPSPGMSDKVNTTSSSGSPQGQAWTLTLNTLWSGRLLCKNRQNLGNSQRKGYAPGHRLIQEYNLQNANMSQWTHANSFADFHCSLLPFSMVRLSGVLLSVFSKELLKELDCKNY